MQFETIWEEIYPDWSLQLKKYKALSLSSSARGKRA